MRYGQGGGGRRRRAGAAAARFEVKYLASPARRGSRGELGPLVVVEVEHFESLVDGAVICHARSAVRPRVRHPTSKVVSAAAAAWQSSIRTGHVAELAELPLRHAEVGRVDPEPAHQVLGRDVVLPRVLSRTRHIPCLRASPRACSVSTTP